MLTEHVKGLVMGSLWVMPLELPLELASELTSEKQTVELLVSNLETEREHGTAALLVDPSAHGLG